MSTVNHRRAELCRADRRGPFNSKGFGFPSEFQRGANGMPSHFPRTSFKELPGGFTLFSDHKIQFPVSHDRPADACAICHVANPPKEIADHAPGTGLVDTMQLLHTWKAPPALSW